MLKILRSLFTPAALPAADARAGMDKPAPTEIVLDGFPKFALEGHLHWHNGFPIPDWDAVHAWVGEDPWGVAQNAAWTACERAWLVHFRHALGAEYALIESDTSVLLSSLEPKMARATLAYMDRTLKRVSSVLDGIAQPPPCGKDILILLRDADSYYNYCSYYYPDNDGEFAYSGGMHIDAGCSHYLMVEAPLDMLEPVIAHEMTHGCLAHLPLPLWLNEGLAVNTERRLAGRSATRYTPQELREKHLSFWGEDEIQEFWSGKSFHRPDDGNLLSYDLASIMVEHMARDWERFKAFVLNAQWTDSGAESATRHLNLELGAFVCSLLGKPDSGNWAPQPST